MAAAEVQTREGEELELTAFVGKTFVVELGGKRGGGLTENIPRVLPDAVAAVVDTTSWVAPPVFAWLQSQGKVG